MSFWFTLKGELGYNDTAKRAHEGATVTQQRIGRYRILERIAAGGQATVYRAWDTDTAGGAFPGVSAGRIG